MNDPEARLDRQQTRIIALGEAHAAIAANSRELDELADELAHHRQWHTTRCATPPDTGDLDAVFAAWYVAWQERTARIAWIRHRALSLTVQNRVISRMDIRQG